MKVIGLSGRAGCGKTLTLNIVYHELKKRGYEPVSGMLADLNNGDFLDILYNGIQTIGIVTQGDWPAGPYSLHGYLERLRANGCFKAICACRTKGGTKNSVKQYPDHTILRKTIVEGTVEDENIANRHDLSLILEKA
ncbi:MAG: hypothetical protein EOP56_10340 [Sphingobacteriales bacterium]|nr:MAG: hypothetical protein EOP56_10340 [Sphingobacteriales bacterium]